MGQTRIANFATHGGSNAQAVIDVCEDGRPEATAAVVVGNNSKSGALERARAAGIPALHLGSALFPDAETLQRLVREGCAGGPDR